MHQDVEGGAVFTWRLKSKQGTLISEFKSQIAQQRERTSLYKNCIPLYQIQLTHFKREQLLCELSGKGKATSTSQRNKEKKCSNFTCMWQTLANLVFDVFWGVANTAVMTFRRQSMLHTFGTTLHPTNEYLSCFL